MNYLILICATFASMAYGFQSTDDLSTLKLDTKIIFTKEYKVNPNEDEVFTKSCHIEPGFPTGSDITPAGSLFKIIENNEIQDEGKNILVITLKSKENNLLIIHCENEEGISSLERSISYASKNIYDKFQIDLITK